MRWEEFLRTDLRETFGQTQHEVWQAVSAKSHQGEFDSQYESLRSMRDCYILQDLLRRHPDSRERHLDVACSRCGANDVYCGHIDLGRADYDDHFWHLCLHCLDARYEERFTQSGYESGEDTRCPFCGYVWP
jgi:hypothetical protein